MPCQGQRGLPQQQPQACNQLGTATRGAGLHLGFTLPLDTHHRELLAQQLLGTLQGWSQGKRVWERRAHSHPLSLLPPTAPPTPTPQQWKPQAAGTGKCLKTHFGNSASSEACSSAGRVCEEGQHWPHRLHIHCHEEGLVPKEPPRWLSLHSLPWGPAWPAQVFAVKGVSQASLQASSPTPFFVLPSLSPNLLTYPCKYQCPGAGYPEFHPSPCCSDSPSSHCQPSQTPGAQVRPRR